jgi:hypothetical protein
MNNDQIKLFTSRLIIIIFCFNSFINSANAGLFTLNNSTDIGVLSLLESFSSFYSYGSVNKASANTGYEEEGTAVMFLAEYADELALITLIDAAGPSHSIRRATMALSDFDMLDVILVDDSAESTSLGFKWRWLSCCTDGMVYKVRNNNRSSFDIDIDFYDFVGLSHFKFLSFSDDNSVIEENILDTSFSIQTKAMPQPILFIAHGGIVPEPTILSLYLLALVCFVSARLNTKNTKIPI